MNDGQHAAQKSPGGRKPRLQHPANRCAHQCAHDQDAKPWIAEQQLPCRHRETLRGKVHRHVGRQHVDVDGLEMDPHRRGRIGQAAVGEGIGCEQKAEVIRDEWKRNGAPGENGQAKSQTGKADHKHGSDFPACQSTKRSFDPRKPGSAQARPSEDQSQNDGGKTALKQCQCDACSWDPGLEMSIQLLCHSRKTGAAVVLEKTRTATRVGKALEADQLAKRTGGTKMLRSMARQDHMRRIHSPRSTGSAFFNWLPQRQTMRLCRSTLCCW